MLGAMSAPATLRRIDHGTSALWRTVLGPYDQRRRRATPSIKHHLLWATASSASSHCCPGHHPTHHGGRNADQNSRLTRYTRGRSKPAQQQPYRPPPAGNESVLTTHSSGDAD